MFYYSHELPFTTVAIYKEEKELPAYFPPSGVTYLEVPTLLTISIRVRRTS